MGITRTGKTAVMVVNAAAITLVMAACSSSPAGPTPGAGGGPRGSTVSMIGVGDIGQCGRPEVAETARLVSGLDGDVLLAGDIAYFQGSAANFRDCFNPTWGVFRPRWHPVPGNHEYESPNAAPYFDFFGAAAGPPGLGYYSFTAGDWLVLMLNSNVPASRDSPQWEFVRNELERQSTPCTMAVWHHPLFTSGPNGSNGRMRDLWALLETNRVEVVLNGHDHLYERFARQTSTGMADRSTGVRQFTAGTGGAELYSFVRTAANSEERILKFGVIHFTLRPAQLDWEFVGIDGSIADRGFDACR